MILSTSDRILKLADPRIRRVFYLGNSDLLGAAAESALKVQELTAGKVIAKSEDPLAFRHGPVSAVDHDTLICFFLSENQHTLRYELDVLTQFQDPFREIGARTILVAPRAPQIALDPSVGVCEYDPEGIFNIPALYQVNLAVLFGQLFGLFTSFRLGLNVDDPSSEKALYSRTVQGVRLYEYYDGQNHKNGDV